MQKGHGISFGDIDHDGDQDIYAVMGGAFTGDVFPNVLFENPGHGNHWITLELKGVQSNRSAIGTRIKISVETPNGDRNIYATVSSGGSFGANSLLQEIGLGQATAIRAIEITWPASGQVQIFKDVKMDHFIRISEDSSELTVLDFSPFELSTRSK
ncbi:ASPIC/UnbV domain-containing protein [Candidatus Thiomargarita nelsonii]|uniref:ASPIC/UnbV domain-containing protein n=1 Tax=Candidatus Thiomargarita nelsonii TaxID=1003181 RepID=A0A176RUK0_9GAMM|nr:ASPIC/UnbV domain-containing protein [Candidatus Thiomargarita nelsonii]